MLMRSTSPTAPTQSTCVCCVTGSPCLPHLQLSIVQPFYITCGCFNMIVPTFQVLSIIQVLYKFIQSRKPNLVSLFFSLYSALFDLEVYMAKSEFCRQSFAVCFNTLLMINVLDIVFPFEHIAIVNCQFMYFHVSYYCLCLVLNYRLYLDR